MERYAFAAVVAAAALLLRLILAPLLGEASFQLFLVAVALAALRGGLGPGLLATALSAVLGHAALLHPEARFELRGLLDDVRPVVFVLEGLLLSVVIEVARRRTRAERDASWEQADRQLRAAAI